MRRRHLRALLMAVALGASAAGALGCGAILGIEEETVPPPPREAGAASDAAKDAADAGDAGGDAADVIAPVDAPADSPDDVTDAPAE